jgi:hypothetical protein
MGHPFGNDFAEIDSCGGFMERILWLAGAIFKNGSPVLRPRRAGSRGVVDIDIQPQFRGC